MNTRTKNIFIFIFMFSVCSLTLQASIINICKHGKSFKELSQQSPITEEEEESHDCDDSVDDEILFLGHPNLRHADITGNCLFWSMINLKYSSNTINILILPPER